MKLSKWFVVITAIFITSLITANIISVKLVNIFGGIVPNLLRMPKAMKPEEVLGRVRQVRTELADKRLHIFGVGGIATLHLDLY